MAAMGTHVRAGLPEVSTALAALGQTNLTPRTPTRALRVLCITCLKSKQLVKSPLASPLTDRPYYKTEWRSKTSHKEGRVTCHSINFWIAEQSMTTVSFA